MNGRRTPSGEVLAKLHEVLFRPSAAELVVPAEVKVMAWKKGSRNGVVVRGAGGPGAGGNNPGGGTVRIGGRVPWGAEVEYAYRAGYDSRGQVSVTHVVDERGYSVMLTKPEPNGPVPGRTGPASEDRWGQPTLRAARALYHQAKRGDRRRLDGLPLLLYIGVRGRRVGKLDALVRSASPPRPLLVQLPSASLTASSLSSLTDGSLGFRRMISS